MPARIRWRGALGMRMEITRTIDASRDGVRVPRSETCEVGSRVWVTFPFDSNLFCGRTARNSRAGGARGAEFAARL